MVVSAAGRRISDGSIGGLGWGSARFLTSQAATGLLIAAISGGLFWLVWIYGNGLRDPRYLDGWVLAGGMSFQLAFHIAIKTASLPPKSAARWRKMHIYVGWSLKAKHAIDERVGYDRIPTRRAELARDVYVVAKIDLGAAAIPLPA